MAPILGIYASAILRNFPNGIYIPTGGAAQYLRFSDDTISSVASSGAFNLYYSMTAISNSGVAAYFAGDGNGSTTRFKISFSTRIASSVSALQTAICLAGGVSNNGTAGYFMGGANGSTFLTVIQKTNYSTDATSTIAATLSQGQQFESATFSNKSTAGYGIGGAISGNYTSTSAKLTFSNETRSSVSGFDYFIWGAFGFAYSDVRGYIAGGTTGSITAVAYQFPFSTETKSSTTSMPVATATGGATSNINTAGYAVGGQDASTYGLTTTRKIAFSNDTWSLLSAQTAVGLAYYAVAGNSGVY